MNDAKFEKKETYIIKPLDVFETESMKEITERLKKEAKIHIITGAEKVGKTALVVKLLCCLLKENSKIFKPVFISLDNTAEYWQNLMQLDTEVFQHACRKKFEISMLAIYLDIKLSFRQHYNFIVIDGIDKCRGVSSEKVLKILFSAATELEKNHVPNVFVTLRSNELPLDNPDLIRAQQEGLIELWHLQRPDYLGVDIKEFGDTRLTIESLF